MAKSNSITKLILILVIVSILIGVLLSYKYNPINKNMDSEITQTGDCTSYIEIMNEVEKPTSRTIVSDKYVSKLDKDSNIVVLGEDGRIISVKKGAVLVSGVVIEADDESYSVYNIDEPEKSVSTE